MGALDQRKLARLLPALLRIQTDLSGDLSLETLAASARMSPFYFHRTFRDAFGETVKQHTLRLRLEWGACRLLLDDARVLDVALECGFRHHETFTRAFRKQFGASPRDYRAGLAGPLAQAASRPRRDAPQTKECAVSDTRIREMGVISIAFLRHVGPYERVPADLWERLCVWADKHELPGPRLLLGVACDAPGITPPDKLRFDAAIRVPRETPAADGIATRTLPPGVFAVTTHVGHYSTLDQAYRAAGNRVREMRGYRLIGLPALEVYSTAKIDENCEFNRTQVYLPVERV